MKKSLILFGLAAACMLGAAEKKDYSNYLKVATDQGVGKVGWTMTSSYATPTVKKLNLEVAPAEVKAAAIEYEINNNPYDSRTKAYVASKNYHWADMIVTLNGKEVFKGQPTDHLLRGKHVLDVDPKLLKAGENVIVFNWVRKAKDDKRVYGYMYFSVDLSEREIARRKIKDPKTRGKVHNDDIRIRLLLSL